MKFEHVALVQGEPAEVFALTQDYPRRLAWDPFLRRAELIGGATAPDVGARAWCVAWLGLGMETEYVSFRPAPYRGGPDDARAVDPGIVRRRLGVRPGGQRGDIGVVPLPAPDPAPLARMAHRAAGARLVLVGDAETGRGVAGRTSDAGGLIRRRDRAGA
jgi:hypothetical protein